MSVDEVPADPAPGDEDRPGGVRHADLRPWTPPCVPGSMLDDTTKLSYLVVDEIVGDTVTLALCPWPGSDPQGRVRFAPDAVGAPAGHLLVHHEELRERLYKGWMRRAPRVGDAFAAVLGDEVSAALATSGEVVLDSHVRLLDALPGDVADLTAEARNIAKLAYYAAMAGVQLHESAIELGQAPANGAAAPLPGGEAPANGDDAAPPVGEVPANGHGAALRVGRVRREPWTSPFLLTRGASDAKRWTVPDERWPEGGPADLLAVMAKEHAALFYFLLNIGDGDSQLLLLPARLDDQGKPLPRQAIVVDAGTTGKLRRLMAALGAVNAMRPPGAENACPLVVATHPHDDHIEGLAEIIEAYGGRGVGDFWEPGYYAPTRSFAELMAAVEDAGIPHCEPTAGMVRFVGGLKITVLAPSVRLRTAYDTYGVDCNDASVVLKVDFPAARISTGEVKGHVMRRDLKLRDPWSIILGADAQTRSWANVTTEFQELHRGHDPETFRTLRKAAGRDQLAAHVLKVSHHASKHGINIELIERIHPQVSLISSVGGGGRYGFPHTLATQAIAEALFRNARSGATPPDGADLGIHYTGGLTSGGRPLGSIALMVPAKVGSRLRMWRFGDRSREDVDLTRGRPLQPVYARKKREAAGSPA